MGKSGWEAPKDPVSTEPVAYYVERVAPGKRDDGKKLGPWFSKAEAEEWVDENHVLKPLFSRESA